MFSIFTRPSTEWFLFFFSFVGMNKINKIKKELKKMLKLPETPERKWGVTCQKRKKEPSLRKEEVRSHFSGTLQTERMFFSTRLLER